MSTEPEIGAVGREVRLTNLQIAVLAVYRLGGVRQRIDNESIAVQCYELAPRRFSWKTRDHPNLATTSEALNDARRPRNGALISGNIKKGWKLTDAGVAWVHGQGDELSEPALRDTSALREEEAAALTRLITQQLYATADIDGPPPSRPLAAQAVRLLPDAPPSAVHRRIDELIAITDQAGRSDIERYLEWLRQSLGP